MLSTKNQTKNQSWGAGEIRAYYQKVLLKLMTNYQVFMPTLAEKGEDDPEDVRQLARISLGLEEFRLEQPR